MTTIYKFGGASVNRALAVSNVANILKEQQGDDKLIVVISAMGKSTNALEQLVPGVCPESERDGRLAALYDFHKTIAEELLHEKSSKLIKKIDTLFASLKKTIHTEPTTYNKDYDRIVSYGEILSTTIVSDYLNEIGIDNEWVDIRDIIYTDTTHKEGNVDWAKTQRNAIQKITNEKVKVTVTQGFIANSDDGTTTLGREGSDYTAAILAYCLNAREMVIWKDVPGFLNADPKYFSDTIKIEQLPYNEAIEQAYYGASVIHPKTIKPLQNKGIALHIKSFMNPSAEGSKIGDYDTIKPNVPLYIIRRNQILLSITPKDFSFIAEENLQVIFHQLADIGIRINMMQNSALSFSICIDNKEMMLKELQKRLKDKYNIAFNDNLELITIRHYTQDIVDKVVDGRMILLEQRSRTTTQLIVCR